jgi:signal transduction histidine kinase
MPQVLVIEDERDILENIVETLELEGFDVIGARNGRQGVDYIQRHHPDVILCDVMMPDFTGYDVLLSLQNDPATIRIPFIFLTALADRKHIRYGMELGADDYIPKPFSPPELIAAINTQLEKSSARRQKYQTDMQSLRENLTHALPHELRTPLMGLIGCAEYLMMDYESIDRQSVYNMAEIILSSANRLQELIENYLLYARIEIIASDHDRIMAMREEHLDYPEIVIEEAARSQAIRAGREADIQFELTSAKVRISHPNLGKIISEIVDNALKFSKKGDIVQVRSKIDSAGLYAVEIVDHGRGMSAEEVSQIGAYKQFNRIVYEQQGLGLGLFISVRLAEIYGGELHILSEPDKGAQVTMTLQTIDS